MEELKKAIKKYSLEEILRYVSNASLYMYRKKLFYIEEDSRSVKLKIPAWTLIDLAYIAIKNTNDYRSKIPTPQDMVILCNELIKQENIKSREAVKEGKSDLLHDNVLHGLPQKQFWWQEILREKNLVYRFTRYHIILSVIPQKYYDAIKKETKTFELPSDALKKETGLNMDDYEQLMALGVAFSYQNKPRKTFTVEKSLLKKFPIATEENLYKCLKPFIGDYRYYREFNIDDNPIAYKPIIKTDKKNYIISSAFLLNKKLYEGIYWIIRDHYKKQNSQDFLNLFGHLYEYYIYDMLCYYKRNYSFRKLKSANGKIADWVIETSKYIIIVEQKSSLMKIDAKKEYAAHDDIVDYLTNFQEAFEQLDKTEQILRKTKKIKCKKVIKLVLHFEKLYFKDANLKKTVLEGVNLNNKNNIFFIDTEEFELLMQALSENKKAFNKIMKEKITLDKKEHPPSLGLDFSNVISRHYYFNKRTYLEQYAEYFEKLWGK